MHGIGIKGRLLTWPYTIHLTLAQTPFICKTGVMTFQIYKRVLTKITVKVKHSVCPPRTSRP